MRLPLIACLILSLSACAPPPAEHKGYGFGPISGAALKYGHTANALPPVAQGTPAAREEADASGI